MTILPAVANFAWSVANARPHARYRRALDQPREAQTQLLSRHLNDNADTAFGRARGFAKLRNAEDYRRAVPLCRYDDLAPYVDRIRAGEPQVLTHEPVRRLVPSSGSTAARKLIPYTASLQREFNAAIGPWIIDLFRSDAALMLGPAYWSVSPVAQKSEAERSAVPIGFDDDAAYLGGFLQCLVGAALAVPFDVRFIQDVDAFRYATLRHLLVARGLRLMSVWHPSFLTLLLDELPKHWTRLQKDLAGRRDLQGLSPENFQGLWPYLRLISCWADGHAALHQADLARRFPWVRIQPKGLLATEAFITIPFAGKHPLAIRSHFFEFLGDDGRSYLAHELEQNAEYAVAVTTGGGLYRYRLGDRIRVDGLVGATPSLRFVGREDLVSDRFGEKLSEGFVGGVLRDVLRKLNAASTFAMLAPRVRDGRTCYVLYIESETPLPPPISETLDTALCDNPHYRYCRDLGQLGSAQACHVPGGAYATYVERCRRDGQRIGDVKAAPLSVKEGWDETFGVDSLYAGV